MNSSLGNFKLSKFKLGSKSSESKNSVSKSFGSKNFGSKKKAKPKSEEESNQKLPQWMEKRFPETRQMTLDLKRIFVFLTGTSGALLIAIGLLFLMGVNFQSTLIYALSFWLLALIVISIFFTYRNLSGLTLRAVQASPCFAGEKAVFELEVSCPKQQKKSAIFIGWKNQDVATVNLHDNHTIHIKLSHSTKHRGRFKPEKLSIFTSYPLGLIKGWSYALLNMNSIVYPAPLLQESEDKGDSLDEEADQGMEIPRGTTDFSGIRDYQAGDSPRHIHWGAYAKTGKVQTKTFVDYASHDLWLDWDALSISGTEIKLSHLCAKVLQYHQEQQVYGLKIPGRTIQPASGEAHRNTCLTALALFGEGDHSDAQTQVSTDGIGS
ncbi:DUF58 domain-containing protein [Cocleimonas flava]|uniref:Uncharacterized protein (DUF58 family) n=1 Tax=Cocleimonas flava TaxID=634765 RepID=A0A4R1EUD5_9GAMM|nr:DUF58 domain-containing protein [Cocleimonas flava]TCJ85306.1 uncharacterized protein (DUF58 family) [Cocleimonas flava]